MRNIAEVTTAVARGDLNRKITVDVKGEILELKNTINTMVDQLNSFAGEVTRVAREVGTEGKLGGQAQVPGVGGTWKDLTDNVNFMASNLTEQVRGIVKVVTAVANGNLTQRLTVQAKGEVAALADTINNMTDTLAIFADQVTNVAREVGVDGRLGGQANVPGAAGTWKDLTGNVNLLAANLTTQVRAIAEVATAVTKGDLTRSIQVETRGEVAELKDNINTMISNLRETTESNREQDWLKTNLARFTGMLQGQRELNTVGQVAADRTGAAGQRAAGHDLSRGRHATAAELQLLAELCAGAKSSSPTRSPWARAWSVSARSRRSASCSPTCRRTSSRSPRAWARRGRSASSCCRCCSRRDQGGHRAGVAAALQRRIARLPGAADAEHRRGVQHHRGDHAHRGPADPVAAADRGAAVAAERAAADQRGAGHQGAGCWPSRMPRSSARTRRSSRRAARWKRRRRSWR